MTEDAFGSNLVDEEGFVSARRELEELSAMYHEADIEEKAAKALKEKLKPAIMTLISEVVREEIPLNRKKIVLPNAALYEQYGGPDNWCEKEYPLWRVVGMSVPRPDHDETEIEIEEREDLVKFEFGVNGYKFGRTVSTSQPSIDLKGMSLEPLFRELEESGAIVQTVHYELDEKKASKFMATHPNSKLVFEKYTVKGTPSARLLPFTAMEED